MWYKHIWVLTLSTDQLLVEKITYIDTESCPKLEQCKLVIRTVFCLANRYNFTNIYMNGCLHIEMIGIKLGHPYLARRAAERMERRMSTFSKDGDIDSCYMINQIVVCFSD